MILIDTTLLFASAVRYGPNPGSRDAMLDRAIAQQISQIWMPNCLMKPNAGMMALADNR